jgi:hypothetical protein
MNALDFAFRLLSAPCMKNEMVIGIIGNTQGVSKAVRPNAKETKKNQIRELLSFILP